MADQDDNDIAPRAYRLWEAAGRPDGRDLEFWLQAEAEAHAGSPPVTNLDRGLLPAERSRVRAGRHGASRQSNGGDGSRPPEHYMAVIDRAHLRIYRVREPETGGSTQFELAQAFDLIAGHQQYTDRDSDMAGRFPGGGGRQLAHGGGSIDERLPMQNEHQRRLVADLAGYLTQFFEARPGATWDFAAGPSLHHVVLERLPAKVRSRIEVTLVKELSHQTPAQLRAHLGL
jgi:hypothetical protein